MARGSKQEARSGEAEETDDSPQTLITQPKLASTRVHETTELLDMILGHIDSETWRRQGITRVSYRTFDYYARTRYSVVSWNRYDTFKRWPFPEQARRYLYHCKTLTANEWSRRRCKNGKGDGVFEKDILETVRELCPNIETVRSTHDPFYDRSDKRLDRTIATFSDGKTPRIEFQHRTTLTALGRIVGCESRWKPVKWEGWDASGKTIIIFGARAKSDPKEYWAEDKQYSEGKQLIIRALGTGNPGPCPVVSIRFPELDWTLDEIARVVRRRGETEFGKPLDDDRPESSIERITVSQIQPFSREEFALFCSRIGPQVTEIHLNSWTVPPSSSNSLLELHDLPELLVDVQTKLPNLTDLCLMIGNDTRLASQNYQSSSASRTRLKTSGALKRVKIAIRGSHPDHAVSTLNLVRSLMDIAGDTVQFTFPEFWGDRWGPATLSNFISQFSMVFDWFMSASEERKRRIRETNFEEVLLEHGRAIDITRLALQPNGAFVTQSVQRDLDNVQKTKSMIQQGRASCAACFDASETSDPHQKNRSALSRITALTQLDKLDSRKDAAEVARSNLVALGYRVDPFDWPSRDDLPGEEGESEEVTRLKRKVKELQDKIRELQQRLDEQEDARGS
ncbi:hypothetical protein BD324DRAFT_611798 [Kockovaella imperatae]|uniref:Uncharacterized protein n=1 Tax=Kockovaella imperatae TaxID=4999 RepID=A0A1Y1URM1_9TREE|nr:hypothetical protein BD324DRAFT_611798 [Kockovaella imperatae]ORX40690.1 hypothetical protein BD324DRAFT_611798 [Kockovaella imperatae]